MLTRIGNNLPPPNPKLSDWREPKGKEKKRGGKGAAGQRSSECVTSSLVISRMAVQFQVHHLPLSATLWPPDTLHLGGASARILIKPPVLQTGAATTAAISLNFAHGFALLFCSDNSRVDTRSSLCLCRKV